MKAAKLFDSTGRLLTNGDVVAARRDVAGSEVYKDEFYIYVGPGEKSGTVEIASDAEGLENSKLVPLTSIQLVQSLNRVMTEEHGIRLPKRNIESEKRRRT